MRKIVYTKALIDLIAGCIFDGLTDEETALLAGINRKTIYRIRVGDECPAIKMATIERMRFYIRQIRDGNDRTNHWQRIAWFMERRWPDRWAKPEVLLNLNTGSNVTNNTLVITAEVAAGLKARNAGIDQELDKLVPPGSKQKGVTDSMTSVMTSGDYDHKSLEISESESNEQLLASASPNRDSISSQVSSVTDSVNVVEEPSPAPAGGTPYAARGGSAPDLPTNSKSVENSRNYKKNSSNSEEIVMRAKGNPPRTGPLGEKLPSKKEIRERKAAAEAELEALKEEKKKAAPPLSKERRPRVPPKILRVEVRGPKSGRKT